MKPLGPLEPAEGSGRRRVSLLPSPLPSPRPRVLVLAFPCRERPCGGGSIFPGQSGVSNADVGCVFTARELNGSVFVFASFTERLTFCFVCQGRRATENSKSERIIIMGCRSE